MRRFLATALILGAASGFGLVGCGEETKVKETEKVTSPTGTTTTSTEHKVESSGSNPPANSAGETGKTAK